MKHDLDVRYSIDEISDKILHELYDNAHKYKDYHTGSVRQLKEDSIKYLKETKYRSGTVNSKSFVGKVLLRIKWKFELTYAL